MKVLDTSVAVDHLRDYPPATALISDLVRRGEPVVASEVVRFELLAGTADSERDGTEALFEVIEWVPVGEEVARAAAGLARRYRRSHSGVDDADYLIAATALLFDAELLTTNVRQFPMFEGLEPPY